MAHCKIFCHSLHEFPSPQIFVCSTIKNSLYSIFRTGHKLHCSTLEGSSLISFCLLYKNLIHHVCSVGRTFLVLTMECYPLFVYFHHCTLLFCPMGIQSSFLPSIFFPFYPHNSSTMEVRLRVHD